MPRYGLTKVNFIQSRCNLGSGWCAKIWCTAVGGEHNLGGGVELRLPPIRDAKDKPFCEKGGRG